MPEIDPVILQIRAEMGRYRAELKSSTTLATAAFAQQERAILNLERQIKSSSGRIGDTLKGLVGFAAIGQVGKLADGYTRYTNQLKVAGLEGSQLQRVQDSLFATAQKYGVELESLGVLYGRTAQGSRELGASQTDLLRFTNGVAAAIKIQGGTASDARGALLQLTQALGGEIVRAEEFNSINEGARPILQAVANGIDKYGGSVAKLRRDVIEGKVASKDFFQGFLSGSAALEAQAEKANLTIAASFNVLNNALGKYIGETDQSLSLTARFSQGVATLANNLGTIIPALAAIGVGYGAMKIGGAVFDLAATGAARALDIDKQLAAEILKGNASYVSRSGLLAAQATAASQAAAAEVAAIEATIVARQAEQVELAETISAERALMTQRTAAAQAAAVSMTQGGLGGRNTALAAQAKANNDAAFARDRLNAANARATIVNVELTAAESALTGAQARATVAAEAEAVAVTANTVAKRAGVAVTALFAGTLTTLGAALPFLAIAALTAGVISYCQSAKEAAFDSKKFAEQGDELAANLAQVRSYAESAATNIGTVGSQAATATPKILSFAGAVGEAAQRLRELAIARRKELFVRLATDEITARQEADAASARERAAGQSSESIARFGYLPLSPAVEGERAAASKVYKEAKGREQAARDAALRLEKIPLSSFTAGSEREGGRDVEGDLSRVTRDLTIARQRGVRSQIESLEAQQFELKQYKKYREQGLSPEASREASGNDKVAFERASAGAQGDRDAKAGASAAKRDRSAASAAARREAAEDRDAAGDAARYASMQRRLDNEIAAAKADIADSAEQRAAIEKARIEDERLNRNEELRQAEKQGQLGTGEEAKTRRLELVRLNDQKAELETRGVGLREQRRMQADALDLAEASNRNEQDIVKGQLELADTNAERHRLALQLLDLQYKQQRLELQAVTVANGRTQTEENLAKARLAVLDRLQGMETASVNRQYESSGQRYQREIYGDINERIQDIEVQGLRRLSDELTNAATKALGLKGALGDVVGELIRIGIERQVIGPIADALFGGGGGGNFLSRLFGGGGASSGVKGGLSLAKASFGRASGGYVGPGQTVRVNENRPGIELLRMGNQGGTVIPLGQTRAATAGAQRSSATPIVIQLSTTKGEAFETEVLSVSGPAIVQYVDAAAPQIAQSATNSTVAALGRRKL